MARMRERRSGVQGVQSACAHAAAAPATRLGPFFTAARPHASNYQPHRAPSARPAARARRRTTTGTLCEPPSGRPRSCRAASWWPQAPAGLAGSPGQATSVLVAFTLTRRHSPLHIVCECVRARACAPLPRSSCRSCARRRGCCDCIPRQTAWACGPGCPRGGAAWVFPCWQLPNGLCQTPSMLLEPGVTVFCPS